MIRISETCSPMSSNRMQYPSKTNFHRLLTILIVYKQASYLTHFTTTLQHFQNKCFSTIKRDRAVYFSPLFYYCYLDAIIICYNLFFTSVLQQLLHNFTITALFTYEHQFFLKRFYSIFKKLKELHNHLNLLEDTCSGCIHTLATYYFAYA